MTPKDIAARLGGDWTTIPRDVETDAKQNGIVIVFGASDDLMEFRGAINDEIGACGGTTAMVDARGLAGDFDDLCERKNRDGLKDFFARERSMREIEAMWCAEENYSWTFKTDIPHEAFEIVEDGEPYCRGIVFALADLAP